MKMSKVLLRTLVRISVLVPMTLALLASTRIASPWPWHGRWKQNSRLEITQITLEMWTSGVWVTFCDHKSYIYIYLESLGRNVGKITPTWRSPAPLQVFPMAQESLLIYHWFDLCKCFSWSTAHEIRLKTNKDMASQIHRERKKTAVKSSLPETFVDIFPGNVSLGGSENDISGPGSCSTPTGASFRLKALRAALGEEQPGW